MEGSVTEMHLTDDQIQEHLDGTSKLPASDLAHMESCPACRQAFEAYHLLFAELATVKEPEPSTAFADTVMQRLLMVSPAPDKVPFRWSGVAIAAAGWVMFAVAAVLTVILVDPEFVHKVTVGMRASIQAFEVALLSSAGSISTELNIKPLMLLFSVLTFSGVALLDRMIIILKRLP